MDVKGLPVRKNAPIVAVAQVSQKKPKTESVPTEPTDIDQRVVAARVSQKKRNTESVPTVNVKHVKPLSSHAVFLQDEKERLKYTVQADVAHAGMFTWRHQDHVLGNILEHQLLRDGRVLFAGYSMPDPIEPILNVQVKTHTSCTPAQAVLHSLDIAKTEVEQIKIAFVAACARAQSG